MVDFSSAHDQLSTQITVNRFANRVRSMCRAQMSKSRLVYFVCVCVLYCITQHNIGRHK